LGLTANSSFPKAFFRFSIVLADISLSTYTIALFKSPPFIKPLSKSDSNSCKKLKVLDSENSDLNSDRHFIVAF
jgi:hypothetical protein